MQAVLILLILLLPAIGDGESKRARNNSKHSQTTDLRKRQQQQQQSKPIPKAPAKVPQPAPSFTDFINNWIDLLVRHRYAALFLLAIAVEDYILKWIKRLGAIYHYFRPAIKQPLRAPNATDLAPREIDLLTHQETRFRNRIERKIKCTQCGSNGEINGRTCWKCRGKGTILTWRIGQPACPPCRASGIFNGLECHICNGQGLMPYDVKDRDGAAYRR